MNLVSTKKIKVNSRGPIRELSGIYGPIITPYIESVRTIASMIKSGKEVIEVLNNNTEVVLSLENYNFDLNTPTTQMNAPEVNTKKEYVKPTLTKIVVETEKVDNPVNKNETPVELATQEKNVTEPYNKPNLDKKNNKESFNNHNKNFKK